MDPTRRQIVQMLAALGLGGGAPSGLGAQGRPPVSLGDLKGALAVQGREMADDDIARIQRALARNLEEFQRVRDLEMRDDVAPPTVFAPRRP